MSDTNQGQMSESDTSEAPNILPDPLTGGTPLSARVEAKKAERINPLAVRGVYLGSAAVLSCAFVFAFVISPGMRAEARAKAQAENQRTVKPSDVLGGGPRDYAELTRPPPEEPVPEVVEAIAASPPPPSAGPAHRSRVIVQRAPREPRSAPAPRPYYDRPSPPPTAPQAPRGPSELERARKSSLFFGNDGGATPSSVRQVTDTTSATPTIARRADYSDVYGDRAVLAPISPYELKAGTVIPAALLTAVDTEREGRILAVVTENVFDTVTGEYLLIPQGARLLGRYNGDQTYGERRAFLVWERIIFADGRSLTLAKEPGVDSAGASGVTGRVDRRLGQLVIASLFSGVITTLGRRG
jgi:type IV secretion system protein TrbI